MQGRDITNIAVGNPAIMSEENKKEACKPCKPKLLSATEPWLTLIKVCCRP